MKDNEHALLWACYRSGQISEKQWQEHLRDDPGLATRIQQETPK